MAPGSARTEEAQGVTGRTVALAAIVLVLAAAVSFGGAFGPVEVGLSLAILAIAITALARRRPRRRASRVQIDKPQDNE